MNACEPRSPEAVAKAVAEIDPENNPHLQKRDITGDGIDETFCNWFVAMVTMLLGCAVPKILARLQIEWLRAGNNGWYHVTDVQAVEAANRGEPVVVGWMNPDPKRSSHVALVRATPKGKVGIFISQAGRKNFNLIELERGFGELQPLEFFAHE